MRAGGAAFPWEPKLGITALFVAAVLFGVIAEEVARAIALVLLDQRIAHWLHRHASPALTRVMLWVAQIHALAMVDLYALLFALYLGWRREWYWAAVGGPGGPGRAPFQYRPKGPFRAPASGLR